MAETETEPEGTVEADRRLEGDPEVACFEARDTALRHAEPLGEPALAQQVSSTDVPPGVTEGVGAVAGRFRHVPTVAHLSWHGRCGQALRVWGVSSSLCAESSGDS